ncbi:hypothetical protein AAFF_G00299780 [Aldrovandia affinis]|uniref:Uncharacterized protein n=1 Tax=Aldrovandia affinis TaxID=143900 RepID=A0AAD7R8P9_9TELE|nr:hypothetical protein AAFF_G00299780 [Aldrovandia affinis]
MRGAVLECAAGLWGGAAPGPAGCACFRSCPHSAHIPPLLRKQGLPCPHSMVPDVSVLPRPQTARQDCSKTPQVMLFSTFISFTLKKAFGFLAFGTGATDTVTHR